MSIWWLCSVVFSKEEAAVPKLPPLLSLAHPNDVLDMPVDPNEPTYCLCHQVSYGEMIGCDNNDVRALHLTLHLSKYLCILQLCYITVDELANWRVLSLICIYLSIDIKSKCVNVSHLMIFFVYPVSDWMVSLCLCGIEWKAQRKMVLSQMHCGPQENQIEYYQHWSFSSI